MNDFSTNLKRARDERNMSRQELADASGLSSAAIGYYETGKREPQASTLIAIATALRMTTDELLGYTAPHDDDFIRAKAFIESVTSRDGEHLQVVEAVDMITITQGQRLSAVRFKTPAEFVMYVQNLQKAFRDSEDYRDALYTFIMNQVFSFSVLQALRHLSDFPDTEVKPEAVDNDKLYDMIAQAIIDKNETIQSKNGKSKSKKAPSLFLGHDPFPSVYEQAKRIAGVTDDDQQTKKAAATKSNDQKEKAAAKDDDQKTESSK